MIKINNKKNEKWLSSYGHHPPTYYLEKKIEKQDKYKNFQQNIYYLMHVAPIRDSQFIIILLSPWL